jgi:hypothetical protein
MKRVSWPWMAMLVVLSGLVTYAIDSSANQEINGQLSDGQYSILNSRECNNWKDIQLDRQRITELERKVSGMQRAINALMAKTGTHMESTTHK